jgi:type IV pilus assembly protein PilM
LKSLPAKAWQRLLDLKHSDVVGLDIGSSSVKLVQLNKDITGYTVTSAGIADIKNQGQNELMEDNYAQQDSVVEAIQNCLSSKVNTKFAVCGVCGPEVAVRYFKFPSLPSEEVGGAVLLEASQVCPFNISEGAFDYRLMPGSGDDDHGFLAAASGKLVERKREIAESAALNCVLMDIDGLALLNCFEEYEKDKSEKTTAILNVGSSCTTLAISDDKNLPFVRDISYSGRDIIKEIATEHKLSTEKVRGILADRQKAASVEFDVGSALAEASEKLITDISDSLRYYMAQENSNEVEQIFVCGGFALVEGFIDLLNKRLSEKVVLWNPFEKMRCSAGTECQALLKEKGPAMTVAAGLAMRSL